MGIRIHKILGYGLNLQKVRLEICTPNDFSSDNFENTALITSIKEKIETLPIEEKFFIKEFKSLYDVVHYDEEGGDPNHIQFIPFGSKEWSRYNDTIDYEEYRIRYGLEYLLPKVDWIDNPLYPYINLMKKNKNHTLGIEKYWIPCYKDNDDWRTHIPFVPLHLYYVLEGLNLVPDNMLLDTFMSIRPCVYTYWG